MQPTTVVPNLTPQTFSYKDILVKKLVRAVACSVISQIVILLIYILVANTNIFSPTEWLSSVLNTFTRLSTWIFVIIFSFIIFAQCLICAKDYVFMTSYCSTRFQQILHVFSFHNFILLVLHVVIGGAFTWQILVVIGATNKSLTISCKPDRSCLVEDTFFLIVGGFWTGLYFFLKIYMFTKQIVFPVIQQRKFLRFRTSMFVLFQESMRTSVWPTMYFAFFYYFWGYQLEDKFMYVINLDRASLESSLITYFYLWWFSTLYFFSMNLMRLFFYMFLTESVQFPVVKENAYVLTLQEALITNNLPIIQHLACMDLYLLSQWSPSRRQLFFTLSQPGGHPHNWNALVENVVKLFNEYADLLKKSTETISPEITKQSETVAPFAPITSPYTTEQNIRYRNLRNMSVHNDFMDLVDISTNKPNNAITSIRKTADETVNKLISLMKVFLGINFLFGELPQVNIQKCLGNGQLIVWASQGISQLAVASLNEDKYGIVQKDMPIIITSLVQLKQHLDKLQKLPSMSKKLATLDDFNYKMKNCVTRAVKTSLFNICLNFGQYFNDLPLSKDIIQYLQVNVMVKNCN